MPTYLVTHEERWTREAIVDAPTEYEARDKVTQNRDLFRDPEYCETVGIEVQPHTPGKIVPDEHFPQEEDLR